MHTAMENVGVQMKMGTHDTVKVAELSDTFANSCECISSVIVLRSVSWRFRSFLSKTWSGIHLQLNSNMTVCVYVCDFAAYRRWFAIILLFVFLFLFFFKSFTLLEWLGKSKFYAVFFRFVAQQKLKMQTFEALDYGYRD